MTSTPAGTAGIRDGTQAPRARELPAEFVNWQLESRSEALSRLEAGERPKRFGAHLPVAITLRPDGGFPAHSAAKGTGFLPHDDHLDVYIDLIDRCLARCEDRPWADTLPERISVIRRFYEHPEHIDFRRVGMLEIFRGRTYHNLIADARLTLHYTGDGPEYPSFQINALAEIVGPEDKRFQFIYLARRLFEHDHFHIHQPEYPLGYLAWVHEVYDKSPFHGRAGQQMGTAAPDRPRPVELKELFIPLDNSPMAEHCATIGLQLAEQFGATVTGSHVYAARLHDGRFKDMEAGLPARYQEPEELERQRHIHDSLITRGLQLISDSYLDVVAGRCHSAGVEFVGKRPEGKNYAALLGDINTGRYDLVVMGAKGLGSVDLTATEDRQETHRPDTGLGSVAERVARRAEADVLLVKNASPIGGRIVVAVDGSPQSFAGVRLGVALGAATAATVEAVAAYDAHFHTVAFGSLEGVLSEAAGKVFRFREQEQLHDEIINDGIAQIYRTHLDTAERVAAGDGFEIETTLLQGKPYRAILAHLDDTEPTLLIVGRLGVHADEGLDLGSTAENLARLAGCHVLLVARTFEPEPDGDSEAVRDRAVMWTSDALGQLDKVPAFARSFARKAIDDYAADNGYDTVTPTVMSAARERLGM